jgi:hypothetical protein
MVNIIYSLLLFVFIFGAASTFLNSSGLYEHQLPTSGLESNTSQATQFNIALEDAASDSSIYNFKIIWMMGQCISGGIIAIITIGPLLESYNVPAPLIAWIISPLGIVLVFWIIEMVLGRQSE